MLCDVDRQAGATQASCGLLSVEPRVCGDTLRCSVVKRFGLGFGWWVCLVAHFRLLLVIEDDRDTGPAHKTIPSVHAMMRCAVRCGAVRCDAMRCDTMLCAGLRYAAM